MARSCCAKPLVRIIRVGDVEAGLMGLDQAIQNVYIVGINNEEEIKNELLKYVRDSGNYISPSRENDYKDALLREYSNFCAAVEQESKVRGRAETSKSAEEQKKKRR